ncbi:sugar phosphate nucleotidyltransferase [bacterium]|jgi:NDP-sugar pyrophosphorylase family protein|nr:sugar phosphate nucleotidyltransferase [Verrucomicrobiales bacterium]MDB2497137.1 sugar phosphate nucleotidyltransferase [Verrucomicrobiales bacterium]MDB3939894.1 sugar phosphate nucleotidyltransferase [Verrucomicrobiales bacterium]MDC0251655.1 sugar phosphate nucleotidyltransferase [bacterium]
MSQVKKAVILAAGRGTRMKEITDELPKPMVKVKGMPILESIVRGLVSNGVTDVLIVVGWRKEVITDYFGDGSDFGCRIEYVEQVVQDGTGRVVELAKDFSGDDPFILSYGDILVPAESYAPLVDFTDVEGKLTVKIDEDVRKGGAVFIVDGMVTDLIEKGGDDAPTSPYYNAGIYSFSSKIYDYTAKLELSPRGEYELTDAIKAQVQDGLPIAAVELDGEWADVRDPEVLDQLNS